MTDDANRSGQNVPSTETPSGTEPLNLNKGAETQSQQGSVSPWVAAQDAAGSAGQAAQNAFQGGINSLQAQGDIAQKKLIAGLLGIFLGSLGVHKLFLGLTTPGVIMLAANVGGWLLTMILTLISFGVLGLFLIPLMSLATGVLGVIGLIEGIIYLTKSDADFQREYVVGKKPWF
jgi:TM2 domain-containing membrane protein YozV